MLLAIWSACVLGAAVGDPVSVEVHPGVVEIEPAGPVLLLDVDFVLTSHSTEELTVGAIELSVLDGAGKLELRSTVNSDGERPSIDVVGAHRLRPGEPELIMNPFQRLDAILDASELRFDFKLYGKDQTTHASVTLRPRRTTPPAVRLPLDGRVWVSDGDDFYSHHRRFDYVSPTARQLGFRSNVLRHAVDLVPLDAEGNTHHGDPDRNESWFGFGRPVLAAAAGTVVAAVDSRPDTRRLDLALLKTDRMAMFGNHVVVQLESGEFALYAHLRQGSVRCKAGDQVRQGQPLGSVGASGGSATPHLHFELQASPDADGEGRPVRFRSFRRILGGRTVTIGSGRIDTGQILETLPASR